MPKFIKISVIIEAEQFTYRNKDRAFNFIKCNCYPERDKENNPIIKIQTSEGILTASLGDWIVKKVNGDFYPCKPDLFNLTYKLVS